MHDRDLPTCHVRAFFSNHNYCHTRPCSQVIEASAAQMDLPILLAVWNRLLRKYLVEFQEPYAADADIRTLLEYHLRREIVRTFHMILVLFGALIQTFIGRNIGTQKSRWDCSRSTSWATTSGLPHSLRS